MEVLRRVIDLESNRYLWIEAVDTKICKVALGIEYQTINSGTKIVLNQEKRAHSTVFVGPGMAQLQPTFIRILAFQRYGHTAGRTAPRCIQNVCGNGAHKNFGP